VPDVRDGWRRAYVIAKGRVVASRTLPPGAGALVEADALLRAALAAEPSSAQDTLDELRLVETFLRRPPPELDVVPLRELRRRLARA
jgi:hypothetical protein